MAIVVESVATTNWNAGGSGTLTITKPTGLAEGNLMVAFATAKEGTPTVAWDDKSGWTTVGSGSTDGVGTKVYAKVADGTDVAASNFTFTVNVTASQCGVMYRLSGATTTPSSILINSGAGTSGTSASQSYSNTITPSANSLIILHFHVKDVATTNGTYAITTSSPTFTERHDTLTTAATDVSCANASGIRPESTATGNASCTWGASVAGASSRGYQVSVPEAASGPANLKSLAGTVKASIKSIDGTAIASVKTFDGTS